MSFLFALITNGQLVNVQVNNPGGTTNYLPKWTSAYVLSLGASSIFDNGTSIGIGTTNPSAKFHLLKSGTGFQDLGIFENSNDPTGGSTRIWIKNTVASLILQSYGTVNGSNLSQAAGIVASSGSKLLIGSGVNMPIQFYTNNNYTTPQITIDNYGRLGIGTTSPNVKIKAQTSNEKIEMHLYTTTVHSSIFWAINGVNSYGFGVDVYGNANIFKDVNNNVSYMTFFPNGNVGIGTSTSANYKLAVNGSIRAKEIWVETNWSDFVFEDNYNLMNLKDLEQYINRYKHLPNIPAATEVEQNGLKLAEMNAKLMMKIEELTLYVIELNKEKDELKTRIEKIEKGL